MCVDIYNDSWGVCPIYRVSGEQQPVEIVCYSYFTTHSTRDFANFRLRGLLDENDVELSLCLK